MNIEFKSPPLRLPKPACDPSVILAIQEAAKEVVQQQFQFEESRRVFKGVSRKPTPANLFRKMVEIILICDVSERAPEELAKIVSVSITSIRLYYNTYYKGNGKLGRKVLQITDDKQASHFQPEIFDQIENAIALTRGKHFKRAAAQAESAP